MGQTASTADIEQDNPRPANFSYAQAERENQVFGEANSKDSNENESQSPDAKVEQTDQTSPGDKNVEHESSQPSKNKLEKKKHSSQISKEDEIDDEQARRDLIAYLEIVGENISNLPMTCRDDPQLGRTVSTLTSREYALKSDAFIPCDIRIIGSSSSRRDRNVPVAIKETLNIGKKATEPGVSSGGAISNSLLKALYDFQNEELTIGASEEHCTEDYAINEGNLFEDDEDNIFADDESFGESFEFEETTNGASLSWSGLLRRMKDDMDDKGYDQVPILTSSKVFDLEEPVHLLPPDFDPKQNVKFSLLVGCNYKGKFGELKSSHDDINTMKDYIINVHGFPEHDDYMTVLVDDKKHKKPTHNNIVNALHKIALRSRPGDAVFIQFAGHGGRVLDERAEYDCYDEVFAPSDFHKRGFVSEKTLLRSLLVRLAEDVTVTMLLDSCDSGVVFDMPYSWETRNDIAESQAKLTINDNFSFMRSLNVVRGMYDTSMANEMQGEDCISDEEDDELVANKEKKNSNLMMELGDIGDKLRDVARDVALGAEIEVSRMVKNMNYDKKASKSKSKSSDDEIYDDRFDDGMEDYVRSFGGDEDEGQVRYRKASCSYDDSDSYESSGSDSFDSYEERIRR